MKKYALFLFLIVSNLFYAQVDSTKLICKYQTRFLRDTTNINSLKEELTILKIGQISSLFKSDLQEKSDSVKLSMFNKTFDNRKEGEILEVNLSKAPQYLYKPEVYKLNDKVLIFDKIAMDIFSYDPKIKLDWKIENEKKEISSYTCQKATTYYRKRKITAWFTYEINIPEGPYNFKGLPGLIIEAYDDKDYYHFKLIELSKRKIPIIPLSKKVIRTEYQQFIDTRNNFLKDPSARFQQFKFYDNIPKEQKERTNKNYRKDNNHLD